MADMNLTGDEKLTFSLSGDSSLNFELNNTTGSLGVELVAPVILDADTYTGETIVTPDFNGTTLETAHKLVTDDITVNPIQVENVSNLSGGITVYIGGIA